MLGERDELVGHEQAAVGWLPAHERLDADDLARRGGRPWAGSAGRARRSSIARRSSPSSARRSRAVARRCSRVVERAAGGGAPWPTYIATSARWSSVSTSSPCSG